RVGKLLHAVAEEGGGNAIPFAEAGDTLAEANHLAAAVREGDDVARHRTTDVLARHDAEVAEVQRGGLHGQQDLTGTGRGAFAFAELQAVEGRASCLDDTGFHGVAPELEVVHEGPG